MTPSPSHREELIAAALADDLREDEQREFDRACAQDPSMLRDLHELQETAHRLDDSRVGWQEQEPPPGLAERIAAATTVAAASDTDVDQGHTTTDADTRADPVRDAGRRHGEGLGPPCSAWPPRAWRWSGRWAASWARTCSRPHPTVRQALWARSRTSPCRRPGRHLRRRGSDRPHLGHRDGDRSGRVLRRRDLRGGAGQRGRRGAELGDLPRRGGDGDVSHERGRAARGRRGAADPGHRRRGPGHLTGRKWLLRTSDTTLTAEDLAAAYKQLMAVESGWRDMKSSLGLRPLVHHREDRIRAHVQLCWLALLLTLVAETTTGQTWRTLRHKLDRLHLVTLATSEGTIKQRFQLADGQKQILTALDLPEPPKFLDFAPVH